MKIVLQHLTKKFPARGPVRGRKNREDVIAVNDFDFEIPDGKLIAGYEGAWIYDKTQMPEEPFIYEPEPAPEESRYPGLELTDAERRLVRMYLMNWRNKLTAQGRDAGPVNDLLIKLMT